MKEFTFLEDYGIPAPGVLKDMVASTMGTSGRELFGIDAVNKRDSLLYHMATDEEFIIPLKAFSKRRLLANLKQDFVVPLGTAAFLPTSAVDSYRRQFAHKEGIVLVIQPVGSGECSVNESHSVAPLDEMRVALDSCGWEKVIVHFKGVIPLAHNQIAALTKFTHTIDRLLGFHEGRFLIDDVAAWLVSASDE